MSHNNFPGGDFEADLNQRVSRGQTLANAQGKLLLARTVDARNREFDMAYKYVQDSIHKIGGQTVTVARVLLVPAPSVEIDPGKVTGLRIDLPIVPYKDASERDRNMFALSIAAHQTSAEAFIALFNESKRNIPTQQLLGEAENSAGTSVKFLLDLEGMTAINSDDDLDIADGVIVPKVPLSNHDLQTELEHELFKNDTVEQFIARSEMMLFGGYASRGNLAS